MINLVSDLGGEAQRACVRENDDACDQCEFNPFPGSLSPSLSLYAVVAAGGGGGGASSSGSAALLRPPGSAAAVRST